MQRLFARPMDMPCFAPVAMASGRRQEVPGTRKYVIKVKSVQKVQIVPVATQFLHKKMAQGAFDLEEAGENSGLPPPPQEEPSGSSVCFACSGLYPSHTLFNVLDYYGASSVEGTWCSH